MATAFTIGSAVGSAIGEAVRAFSSSKNESNAQTVYDPYASLFEKRLTSNLWKEDTNWYNNKIVSSAYQRARQSLENAGYNPLMALQYGGLYDQAPTVGGSATKASSRDISSAKSFDRAIPTEIDNAKADTTLKYAQTDYTNALSTSEGIKQIGYQTDNAIKESEKIIANSNASYQEKRNAIEIKNIASQTKKNIAEIGLINTQKTLNSAYEKETREKINNTILERRNIKNMPIHRAEKRYTQLIGPIKWGYEMEGDY